MDQRKYCVKILNIRCTADSESQCLCFKVCKQTNKTKAPSEVRSADLESRKSVRSLIYFQGLHRRAATKCLSTRDGWDNPFTLMQHKGYESFAAPTWSYKTPVCFVKNKESRGFSVSKVNSPRFTHFLRSKKNFHVFASRR